MSCFGLVDVVPKISLYKLLFEKLLDKMIIPHLHLVPVKQQEYIEKVS